VSESVTERYLRLGLQVGRHVDGIVDAYFGPSELQVEVDAAPPVEPRSLASAAQALLDELEDGWLRDQVVGLRAYAGVLAGEDRSYADEVEGCFGVRPMWTDESVFAAAHERLEQLLPGDGPLAERHERWTAGMRVPPERVERTVTALIERARTWSRSVVELPDGEDVVVEVVRDVPWMAFCEYLGDLQSRISVNVDLTLSAIELLILAIHETYPGHHAERCCKEEALVRDRGLLEESIVLVPTPQSLVAEGIAKIAPGILLGGEGGANLASVLHDAGVSLDLEHALAVQAELEPCRWAEVNAGLMLYERGASEAEAHAYLRRWGLMTEELADHLIRFLREPTSRTYPITYPAGHELCEAYVAGDPARFRRLLTAQVRVGELLAATS
jgi:hypothetical protein